MAANDQVLPAEPPTDTGCPDLEDIAAFLDGTLAPERRESMIEHLASCESCYEIFAGAARYQAEEPTAQDDLGLDKGRADRPFERRRPVRARPWRRGAAAAIAAILVAGIAPLVWWRLQDPGATSPEGLSAALLKSPAATLDLSWWGSRMRGPGQKADVPPDLGDFRLGVRLLDLRLALATGKPTAAEETLRRLDNLFNDLWLPLPNIRAAYRSIQQELQGKPPAALLPRAEAAEKSLLAAGVEREFVELGSWTEACRLAGATRQPEIFRSRAARRLLERAQAPSAATLGAAADDGGADQKSAQILRQIKAAAGAPKLDFGVLASQCTTLLEALDADY